MIFKEWFLNKGSPDPAAGPAYVHSPMLSMDRIEIMKKGLEDTILALIDDVDVGVENFTFPDFLIFVSQRKKGNGALKLFEEYDTGKIFHHYVIPSSRYNFIT